MAPPTNEPRFNDKIRAREVRVIGPDGSQLGIKSLPEALGLARELDLDLVEVAPLATPPVCRIMDYGKFRYEESQRAREARKKTAHVTVKEVKFRPKIGKGDFDTKVRHVVEFLNDGHKVKVSLQFRGREMAHPELGSRILDEVIEKITEVGKVETQARLEGRSMTMVLVPEKKILKKKDNEPGDSAATDSPATDSEVADAVTDTPVTTESAPAATESQVES